MNATSRKSPNPKAREWNDEQKAAAIAALHANGFPHVRGAICKTAKDLGVPRPTLQAWVAKFEVAEKAKRETIQPLISLAKENLAEAYRAIVCKALGLADGKLQDCSGKDLMVIAAVGTEKMLLLSGQATSRSEHVKVDPREQALALLAFLREQKQPKQVELLPSTPEPAPDTTAPNSGETHP